MSSKQEYEQADEEGVMVLVSRQAIHEVADQLTAANSRIAELEAALGECCQRETNIWLDYAGYRERHGDNKTPIPDSAIDDEVRG